MKLSTLLLITLFMILVADGQAQQQVYIGRTRQHRVQYDPAALRAASRETHTAEQWRVILRKRWEEAEHYRLAFADLDARRKVREEKERQEQAAADAAAYSGYYGSYSSYCCGRIVVLVTICY